MKRMADYDAAGTVSILANSSTVYLKREWYSATQQTRNIYPMFDQCWPTVYDVGPTLVKYWLDVSCLLGKLANSNWLLEKWAVTAVCFWHRRITCDNRICMIFLPHIGPRANPLHLGMILITILIHIMISIMIIKVCSLWLTAFLYIRWSNHNYCERFAIA